MDDNQFKQQAKDQFLEHIAKPYINDEEFRKLYHCKYLIFTKHKLICVAENFAKAYDYKCNHCKILYYIGDDQPTRQLY